MAEQPSALLTVAQTLAGSRGAVTLAGALSIPLQMPGVRRFRGATCWSSWRQAPSCAR